MSTELLEDISDSKEMTSTIDPWPYPVPQEMADWLSSKSKNPQDAADTFFGRKYVLDRAVGVALLLPASLIIGVCWLLVKLTSRGPGFYRQTRMGLGGETFQLLKLRTMRIDAEDGGIQWSSGKGDPRRTAVGCFLRALHLDELPQLINVARGEMSLVGPRPERPEITAYLECIIPGYHLRHNVKPGVTGLSQINIEPDTNVNITRRKQILDLRYIGMASHIFDLRILAATFLRMFGLKGQRVMTLMCLSQEIENRDLRMVGYQFDADESELWSPGKPLPERS